LDNTKGMRNQYDMKSHIITTTIIDTFEFKLS